MIFESLPLPRRANRQAVVEVGRGNRIRRAKPVILVKTVVVGFEREGYDEMVAAVMPRPKSGNSSPEIVAIIQKIAVLKLTKRRVLMLGP